MARPRAKCIIRYTGMDKLSSKDQYTLRSIINKEYEKIQGMIRNITDLVINIKLADKQGKRKRYYINIRAEAPTMIFTAARKETDLKKLADWDIAKATHKSLNKLKKEVTHQLRPGESAWKKSRFKEARKKAFYE